MKLLKCDHCSAIVDASDADKLMAWRHVRVHRAAWSFAHGPDTVIMEYHACTDRCLRDLLRAWADR